MTERRSIPSRNRRVPSRLLSPSPETINNATTTTTSTQSQAPSRSSTRSNAGVHSARQREDEVVEASLGKRKRRPSNMKELPATITSRSESFSPPAPSSGVNSSSANQSLSTNPPIRLKLRVTPLNNPQQSSSSPSISTRSTLPPVSESTCDSNPPQSISTAIARHSRFNVTPPQQHHSSLQAPTSASSLNASSSYGHHDFSSSLGSGDLGGYDSDAGDATTALLRAQEPDYASDMDLEEQEERSCYNGNGAVDIRNGKSRSRRTTSTIFDPSSKKRSISNSRNGPSRIKIKSHNRSISVNGLKSKDYSFEDASSLDFSSSSTKTKSRIRSASMNVHKTSKLHHSRSQTQIEDVKNHKHLPSSSLSGSRLGHEEMGMDMVFEGMDDAEFNERDTLAYEGEESSDPEEDEEDDFHEAMLNGNDYDLEGAFSQSSRSEKAHFIGVGRFDFPSSKLNKSRNQHSERIEGSGSGSTTDIDAEDTPATTPRSPVSVGGELESAVDYSASKKSSDATLSAQQGDPKSNNSSPSKSKPNLDASRSAPLATRTRSAVNASKKESLEKISIPVKSKSQAEPASTSSDLSSAASIRKGEAVFAHALPSPPKPRADAGKLFLSLPWGDNDEENDGERSSNQERKNGKDEVQASLEDGEEGEASVTEAGKKASARNTTEGLQSRRNAATRHHSSFNESNSSATAVSTGSSTNTPSRSGTLQDSNSNAEDKKGIASTSPLLSPSDSVRALHLHLNLGRPSSGLVGGMPSPSLLTPGLHRTSSGLGMGIGVDGDIVLSPSILKGKQLDGLKEPEALNLSESVEGNEKIESDEVEEELIGSSSTKETSSSSKPRLNSSSLKALQKPNTRTSHNETSNAGAEEGMEEDDSHSSLSAGSDWLQNARSVSADLSPTRADYQNEAEEEDMLHQFGRPEDMPLSELDLAWGVEAGEADDDLEMMNKKGGVSGELSTSAGTENESRRSRMNGSDSITPQKRSNASMDNDDKAESGGSSNQKVVQTRGRKSSKRTK